VTAPTAGDLALGLILVVAWAIGWGLFAARAWRLYRYLRLGRDEDRTDRPLRRIRDEIVVYLGQRKLLKRPYLVRGIAHALVTTAVPLSEDEAKAVAERLSEISAKR